MIILRGTVRSLVLGGALVSTRLFRVGIVVRSFSRSIFSGGELNLELGMKWGSFGGGSVVFLAILRLAAINECI